MLRQSADIAMQLFARQQLFSRQCGFDALATDIKNRQLIELKGFMAMAQLLQFPGLDAGDEDHGDHAVSPGVTHLENRI